MAKRLFLFFFLSAFINFNGLAQNTLDANIPETLPANSFFTIEITINKGNINSFSKYQLEVPDNITISEGNSLDGHFSFVNKRAKIVWVECPKASEFTFTMRMYVGFVTGEATFEHKFYYVDANVKKDISDAPIHVKFTDAKSTVPLTDNEPKKENISIAKSGTVNLNEAKETTPVKTVTTETKPSNSSNTVPVKFAEPVVENKIQETTPTKTIEATDNKEYKVQIASMASKPDLTKYAKAGKVSAYEENGMYKVVTGSYKTKEEAVKRMEELKGIGYNGFVVLFMNGVKAK